MAPTILVAGATGNTGRSTVETLSRFLKTSSFLSGYRIVALTRSSKGLVAQELAKLPGVEVIEKNWIEVTANWLRENEVVRAFVASQPNVGQFTEESTFLVAALQAAVTYVVRISTCAPNVRPDSGGYYPRSHWALEALLSTPEFEALQWTSLQPNVFSRVYFQTSVEFIKQYRKTGKQGTLRIMASEDGPLAIIDPYDIGVFAAHLLAQEDPTPHSKAKYVINGPEDTSGRKLVKLVEQYIGTKVEDVIFKDTAFIDVYADNSPDPRSIVLSIKESAKVMWDGICTASTTSKQVLELAAPTHTPAEMLKRLLEE